MMEEFLGLTLRPCELIVHISVVAPLRPYYMLDD